MANATLARLLVRIGADASQFAREMYKSEQSFRKTARGLRSAGNNLSVGVTAPLLAISGASLKMAMDAEESENLFTVSMGRMAAAAREWSEDLQKSLGLNGYELRRQVGEWNVLFTNMGLGEQQAFDMSKALVELGGDMASFYNFTGGAAEASEKLRSIMAGETEVARRLGIDISAAAVKTAAYTSGLAEQDKELTESQKLFARYQILLKQTSKAQGDLARTLDSPTNQLRVQKEQFKLTAVDLGKALIPSLQAALPAVRDFASAVKAGAEALNAMDPESRKVVLGIAALLAAAGPATRATSVLFSGLAGGARIARQLSRNVAPLSQVFFQLSDSAISTSSASIKASEGMARASAQAVILKGALAGVVAVASYQLTKTLLESVGFYDAMAEKLGLAADKNEEWIEQLTSSSAAYTQQLGLYDKMRENLGLLGEEWRITADHTEENARRLTELLPKVAELQRAHNAEAAAKRQSNEVTQRSIALVHEFAAEIRAEEAAVGDVTAELAKLYGVLRQKDAEEQMSKLVEDFSALARDGVSAKQLLEAFGPRVRELADAAGGYANLDMPQQFRDLEHAVRNPAFFKTFIHSLQSTIPEAMQSATEQVIQITRSTGEVIEGNLSGGFGRGVDDGVEKGIAGINRLQDYARNNPIRIPIEPDDFRRSYNQMMDSPDTSGPVP